MQLDLEFEEDDDNTTIILSPTAMDMIDLDAAAAGPTFNIDSLDLSDISSGITFGPTAVTITAGGGGGASGIYTTTGTGGGGYIGNGSGSPFTFNDNWATLAPNSGRITLTGEDADIDVNGVSLIKTLTSIQDRLNILTPDPDMEQEWDELAELRRQYDAKLEQCREKSRMWKTLKSMPPPPKP